MKVAIIDADFKTHGHFPNLCCLKLSGYHRDKGDDVILKLDYENLNEFDRVYIAKVFTDSPVPDLPDSPHIIRGGTGFFFDKAPPLPDEIEHTMPDYQLYDGVTTHKAYTDYSIGYLTRGCFRHCQFCVNRNLSNVVAHSPLREFYDPLRKKICLLDDNFFGYKDWIYLLHELQETNRPFMFKQGLDIRLMTEKHAQHLFRSNYDGFYYFAFDNVQDSPIIEEKLKLIQDYANKQIRFYVICGFDRLGKYDEAFWIHDIQSAFERIRLIKKYGHSVYVARFNKYKSSPWAAFYNLLAAWSSPYYFKKLTFEQFCELRPYNKKWLEKWQNATKNL